MHADLPTVITVAGPTVGPIVAILGGVHGDEYEGPVTGGPYPVPRGPGGHAGRRPVLESHVPSHATLRVGTPSDGMRRKVWAS